MGESSLWVKKDLKVVIEQKLRKEMYVSETWFGFMPTRSNMDATCLLRCSMENVEERNWNMVLFDSTKAYYRALKELMWWV